MRLISPAICLVSLCLALPCFGQEGKLKTVVDPTRAGVFVDGKYLGPSANFKNHRVYSLPAGEHELKLVDPRYEEFTQKITITAGKTTTVHQSLKKLPEPKGPFGTLRTEATDKFAAVYLNNKFYGHVDEFSNVKQGLLLPPGTYDLRIVPTSGTPHEEKVTITANQVTLVKAK